MDVVTYRCPKCARSTDAPRERVLEMIQRKRTRCQLCGAPLELPVELAGACEAEKALETEVEYSCVACKRPVRSKVGELVARARKGKVRCQRCGGELVLPDLVKEILGQLDAVGAVPKKVEVPCLACGRRAHADLRAGEQVLKCGYCGARFRAPREPGGPSRGPPLEVPAAAPHELKEVLARAPKDELSQVAARALLARAGLGEVALAEAVTLTARLLGLSGWRPDGREVPPCLPVPVDEAERVVPWLLFGGLPFHVDRRAGVDLVFEVGSAGTEMNAATAINLLSLTTVVAGGGGLFILDEPGRVRQRRLRVSITAVSRDAVTLSLATQIDDGKPSVTSGKAHSEVSASIAQRAGALRAYYALLAVLGPGAEGLPAAHASEEAIRRRLEGLGGFLASKAPALAEKLRVVLT